MIQVFHHPDAIGRIATFDPLPKVEECVKVADVDTDNLETAYRLTNTIDYYWWNNEEVTPHFEGAGCRSTSVGDILVEASGKAHMVSTVGFTELP